MPTATIPASIARTQLGSLLKEVAGKRSRFIITKSGKPLAALFSVSELDDILEELDAEFQKDLKDAYAEYCKGEALTLKQYLKERLARSSP